MPKIDIMASNLDQSRMVTIQVKTKRFGTWHTSIDEGRPCEPKLPETAFWVFIDIGSSKHHAIDEKRIKQWKDKWGLLDVF